jgi:hypothetical protein
MKNLDLIYELLQLNSNKEVCVDIDPKALYVGIEKVIVDHDIIVIKVNRE